MGRPEKTKPTDHSPRLILLEVGALIDKNGPIGARGASFGGSWTAAFNPFCTERASPTASSSQDRLNAQSLGGRQN